MENQQLTQDQALNNLAKVCAVYKGELQEHMVLQESLRLVKEKLEEKKEDIKTNTGDQNVG